MELEPSRMVHGGAALARLPGGRVALVRGALPGERVAVELTEQKGVLQGRVERVLEPSPDRVPESEHPGLDFSFIRYERQLELKREVTADALARAGAGEVAVPPVVAAPAAWGYRHAVQPAATRAGLGYRLPESHEIKTLDSDPVACDAINRVWRLWTAVGGAKGVREVVFRANHKGEVLLSLVASGSARNYLEFSHSLIREKDPRGQVVGVAYAPFDPRGRFRKGSERLAGARSLLQRYGRFEVSVTAVSFAQPNPAAASGLYERLAEWAGTGAHALDLFAGSGVIGLHLAEGFGQVTALEIDRGSVVRGERDAARLGIDNLTFGRADARSVVVPPDADLIAVDPPRAGLAKAVREALTASSAPRLLYVSCDIATWARDVAAFQGMGWRLERLQPYDFYPQTHHLEMLSLLTR